MVRSAMLLASAFPDLRDQATKLATQLGDLQRVMGNIRSEGDRLRAETDRLNEARTRLASLMEAKKLTLARAYHNRLEHDPSDINRAREIASDTSVIPVGILYRNPAVPCYEDVLRPRTLRTAEVARARLDAELDKHTVWPRRAEAPHAATGGKG